MWAQIKFVRAQNNNYVTPKQLSEGPGVMPWGPQNNSMSVPNYLVGVPNNSGRALNYSGPMLPSLFLFLSALLQFGWEIYTTIALATHLASSSTPTRICTTSFRAFTPFWQPLNPVILFLNFTVPFNYQFTVWHVPQDTGGFNVIWFKAAWVHMWITQHAWVQCRYRASVLGSILFSNCVRSHDIP